jgi:drug/metabolite transporter (DMT)-like permease
LASRLGPAGGYPFFAGNLICWMIYHGIFAHKLHKKTGVYWSKEHSMYFHKQTKRLRWEAILGPICRGFMLLLIFFLIFFSLKYAHLAKVNQGVIGSIYSTSIIFSALLFFFIYNEIMSFRHLIGMFFMIGCVSFIAFGGEKIEEDLDP